MRFVSPGATSSRHGDARVEIRRIEGRAGDIMQAARGLFEHRGVGPTTVKDIASEAGITRELFYYYYSGKRDVVDAVLDDYVADIVESVAVWDETRHFGDTSASLRECIATLRRTLYDANGPRPMIAVLEELGVRDAFDVRAVRETANFICEKVVSEYERYHDIKIDLVYETMCVMIFGLVGLLKVDLSISDEALMKVVEQTFRLDMRPLPCCEREDWIASDGTGATLGRFLGPVRETHENMTARGPWGRGLCYHGQVNRNQRIHERLEDAAWQNT